MPAVSAPIRLCSDLKACFQPQLRALTRDAFHRAGWPPPMSRPRSG